MSDPHNPYEGSTRLAEWLGGALLSTLERQHHNGAFDSFTPYSQDHGVTLAMVLSIVTTVESLGDAVPDALRTRARDAVQRACRFAARSGEDYAFISNHQAAFALAWLRASRCLDDPSLAERSDAVVAAILARQSRDGWFAEYGGADPGYETFALTYLSLVHRERPNAELLRALERSVGFLSYCVHPDGSIGGNYGSRHTGQFAPGGLEVLAGDVAAAGAIASFVARRVARGNVVTPLVSDDDNLPLLTFSYAVAAEFSLTRPRESIRLPCEKTEVLTTFDDSGFAVAGTPRYFAVANLAKGGVIRVFDRASESLAYEDSGFRLRAAESEWVSHLAGEGVRHEVVEPGVVRSITPFWALKQEVLTPLKFLVLRILNLTVFRSVTLGAAVRRMIIARLITSRRVGPWQLVRTLRFTPDRVEIDDEVTPGEAIAVTFASLERSLLPLHMGSARYFHANELREQGHASLDDWCPGLSAGRPVQLRQIVQFDSESSTISRRVHTRPPSESRERITE